MNTKLQICKQTRAATAKALYDSLKKLLGNKTPISEVLLRNTWLTNIRQNKNIFPDGWYMPPVHGMTVLFGTDDEASRINISSLRPEEFWPKKESLLNRDIPN